MAQYVWGDVGRPLQTVEYIVRDNSWLKGSTLISAFGHGTSWWSQAGKIEVLHSDGVTKERFFLKLTETPVGRTMAQGEFESTKTLYRFAPDLVPRPIAWGTYELDPNVHWYMCEYIDLIDEAYPTKIDFCTRLIDMQRKSQREAPQSGMFGFHVVTCNGMVPQYTKWTDSWEEFYTETLRELIDMEIACRGPCAEFDELLPALYDKVCPRLLRPLETEGRSIQATACHGDLWHGNTAQRAKDGSPVMFDPAALWAHREFELHSWRGGRYVFNKEYMHEYFAQWPPSEPAADWDDRNLLYYLVCDLHDSILYARTDNLGYRAKAIKYIRELVTRYPDGYTGPWKRKGLNGERTTGLIPGTS